MKNYCLKNLFIGLLLSVSTLCWAELRATVDRDNLAINESLQLVVRFSGQAISGEPDFRPIEKDFDIVSTSRQQQYSVINGNSESYTDWKMILLPKRSGQLLIPPLNYKGNTSSAVTINVRPASSGKDATNGTNNQPVYTETEVDKQTAYIQEQIILTVRLVTSVQLQDFSYSELEIPDVLTQKVAETQFQKVINGRNHLVVEIKFALFPQQAGKLDIPALRMGAYEISNFSQFGGFPSRGKRLLRLTEEQTINILPKPVNISVNQWMPSSNLEINDNWSDNSGNLKVGEPITRTITISARGLTAAQIQPLPELQSDNFKLYPDQPKLDDQTDNNGVLGQRTETFAIVPSKPGTMVIPALQIQWWDTVNKRLHTSTLPSRTFNVRAADALENSSLQSTGNNALSLSNNLSNSIDPNYQNDSNNLSTLTRWSMALNVLLIVALVVLVYLRRPHQTRLASALTDISLSDTTNLNHQLKLIERQALANNLGAMRDSILKWGAELFPEHSPKTLQQLGSLMGSDPLIHQFAQLDEYLFKLDPSAETFNTVDLIANLRRFRRSTSDRQTENGLKPLYPEQ